jgi:hypothetical protein
MQCRSQEEQNPAINPVRSPVTTCTSPALVYFGHKEFLQVNS